MNNTLYSFAPLKQSQANCGNPAVWRVSRLIVKGAGVSEHLMESMGMVIPKIKEDDVKEIVVALLPEIVGMIEEAQDKMLREIRVKEGVDTVNPSSVSLSAVVEWIHSQRAGAPMSAAYLEGWFADRWGADILGWLTSLGISGDVAEEKKAKLCALWGKLGNKKSAQSLPIPALKGMLRFADVMLESPTIDGDSKSLALVEMCSALLEKKESELSMDALGF